MLIEARCAGVCAGEPLPGPGFNRGSLRTFALVQPESRSGRLLYALINAAAMEAGYTTLYSENFQDGQITHRKLTFGNPFR